MVRFLMAPRHPCDENDRTDSHTLEVVVSPLPPVILFDVNETLSDMNGLQTRFTEVGAPAHLSALWFATALREGFTLTAAGGQERFAVLADHALRRATSPLPEPISAAHRRGRAPQPAAA